MYVCVNNAFSLVSKKLLINVRFEVEFGSWHSLLLPALPTLHSSDSVS